LRLELIDAEVSSLIVPASYSKSAGLMADAVITADDHSIGDAAPA
jgi:hypothetical protein